MKKLYFILLALSFVVGLKAETYVVNSALTWEVLAKRAAAGETFRGDVWDLRADISIDVATIPSFAGTIEGNSHTVTSNRPLIDVLESGGCVKDLSKEGMAAYWGTYGCIVDEVAGTVLRCKNYSNYKIISYTDYIIAGGIAGKVLSTGSVINCENHGSINGTTQDETLVYFPRVGGIVGWNLGTVMGCVNSGDVTASADANVSCGGIVGHMESGSVSFCTNSGNVSSTLTSETVTSTKVYQRTGGIVGRSGNARIDACVNSGKVTNNMCYVGGIVGECYMTDVTNCVNSGAVFSSEKYFDSYAGGIAGKFEGKSGSQALLLNCANTGNITSYTSVNFRAWAAGIGAILYYADFGNCLNSGTLSASGKTTYKEAICITGNNCTELNKPANAAEANKWGATYNADASHHYLMPIAGDGASMAYFNRFGMTSNQGTASFYSATTKPLKASIVSAAGGSATTVAIAAGGYGTAKGLSPATEYAYTVYDGSNIVTRSSITTPSLGLKLVQDLLRWNTLQAHATYTAKGLDGARLSYSLGDGETGEWTDYEPEADGSFATKSLQENRYYHLLAVVTWNGGSAQSEPLRVTTPYISPDYVETARGIDWLGYRCMNVDELRECGVEEYGLYTYRLYSNGTKSNIETYIGTLHPDVRVNHKDLLSTNDKVHIEGYTVRGGEKKYFPLDIVKLPFNVIDDPDFVSPNAFRLCAGISNVYPSDVAIFGSYQTTQLTTAYCAPGSNLCHFICNYPSPSFYNVYIQYKGSTKCNKDIDLTTTNCEYVPPYLMGIKRGSGMAFTCYVGCGEDGLAAWSYVIRARELGTEKWTEWTATYKKPDWSVDYYVASGSVNTGELNYNPAKTYEVQFCARRGNDFDVSETMLISGEGNQTLDKSSGVEQLPVDTAGDNAFGDEPDTYSIFTLDGRCVLTLRNRIWSEARRSLDLPHGIYIVAPSRRGAARKMAL